jgi:hypothetical protein
MSVLPLPSRHEAGPPDWVRDTHRLSEFDIACTAMLAAPDHQSSALLLQLRRAEEWLLSVTTANPEMLARKEMVLLERLASAALMSADIELYTAAQVLKLQRVGQWEQRLPKPAWRLFEPVLRWYVRGSRSNGQCPVEEDRRAVNHASQRPYRP